MRISDWSSACALPIFEHQQVGVRQFRLQRRRGCGAGRHVEKAPDAAAVVAQRLDAQRDGVLGNGAEVLASRLAVLQVERDLAGHGRSEEHTSELQSLMRISYAVFCLNTKKNIQHTKYMDN